MADPEKAQAKPEQEDAEMAEEGDDDQAVDADTSKELVSKLMKDPQVLASLQDRLQKYLGHPSGYIQSLPKVVKRRIKALKKLQLEFTNMEANFYKEVHALEVRYDQMHQPLYEKRQLILNGEYEPTDEEAAFTLDEEDDKDLCEDLETKVTVDEDNKPDHDFDENTKGIPEFWLTIFKNVDLLSEMLQDHDEPILKHLTDIKVKFVDEPMGFNLEFHFSENEYFTNKCLTKSYEMKCEPDKSIPFSFEGPEIVRCKGCSIDWKKDKNVTLKVIKKKQKHKTRTAVRTVTKTVNRDSFFNFFNPPAVPDDSSEEELDSSVQTLLTADFEIGHYIRERIVPRAVLFFTGEALDDDDFEEEDDGEDGEGLEEEDDPDYEPSKDAAAGQDCKQQ